MGQQTGAVLARELGLKHGKGEDITEVPERWQIQQFPRRTPTKEPQP